MKQLSSILFCVLFSGCMSQPAGPSNLCQTDKDCVPSTCCHPSQCSAASSTPECKDVVCTLECRSGTLDCGGSCRCIKNKCAAMTAQPHTKETCELAGGSWQSRFAGEFCNFPADDAGNTCNSSEQCEGECVVDSNSATSGKCSEFKTVYGCVTLLEKGKALGICID